MVRTPPFHGGNRGSNPLRVAKIPASLAELGFCFATRWGFETRPRGLSSNNREAKGRDLCFTRHPGGGGNLLQADRRAANPPRVAKRNPQKADWSSQPGRDTIASPCRLPFSQVDLGEEIRVGTCTMMIEGKVDPFSPGDHIADGSTRDSDIVKEPGIDREIRDQVVVALHGDAVVARVFALVLVSGAFDHESVDCAPGSRRERSRVAVLNSDVASPVVYSPNLESVQSVFQPMSAIGLFRESNREIRDPEFL